MSCDPSAVSDPVYALVATSNFALATVVSSTFCIPSSESKMTKVKTVFNAFVTR